jgi:CelD/BcsL family acetyltransferase involved in cellulose biosynthesis
LANGHARRDDAVLTLDRVDPERVDWDALDSFADRNVYQTREWLTFTAKTQHADPVIATVNDGGEIVGYFTGLIVRRYGIRILGSPFRGWTTAYLGFNLREGVSRGAAVAAMLPFAFDRLRCGHVELRDRHLALEDLEGARFAVSPKTIFEVDLRPSDDELLARMTSACRRCIRKAEKVGVTIEEADDIEFADEYYEQLQDVFAKQSLVPTYDATRVAELIRHLQPTGRLLLLRARNEQGECIATGIFPAMNGTMYFWGGASWREFQILRPNESLMWYAMRYWKSRGIEWCDLGGGAEYKRKYGPLEVSVPFFRKSRSVAFSGARDAAKKAVKLRQAALGRLNMVRKT